MSQPAEHVADGNPVPLDAAQVAAWLRAHPDFFAEQPDLLEALTLPHASGSAVSLVERQLGMLRERNGELRQRLDSLVAAAKDNDSLFHLTSRLVLDLLDCSDSAALQRCLARHLQQQFGASHCALVLFAPAAGNDSVRQAPVKQAETAVGHLFGTGDSFCGPIRGAEASWLFPDAKGNTGSAVVLRLKRGREPLGLLAIGSDDASRFGSDMGTLFIRHLGDVLVRLLP